MCQQNSSFSPPRILEVSLGDLLHQEWQSALPENINSLNSASLSHHKNICLKIKQWNLAWSLKCIKKKQTGWELVNNFWLLNWATWMPFIFMACHPPRGSLVHHSPSFVSTQCLQGPHDMCLSSHKTCRGWGKPFCCLKTCSEQPGKSGFVISIC